MGKRQECALETKKKIVEALRELLHEKPANDINIEEITTRAGVAKGSFYTYFKRKEDVVSVIAMEEYDIVRGNVMNSTAAVQEKIAQYVIDSAKIIEINTLQIAQNWLKSVTAPLDCEHAGVDKYTYDRDNLYAILKDAVEKNELKETTPIDEIAECVMNVYYGAVANWCITKGTVSLVDGVEHFCNSFLKKILADYLR